MVPIQLQLDSISCIQIILVLHVHTTQLYEKWCGVCPAFQKLFFSFGPYQKLLTREKLIKKGFFGPYRCCLCQQADESTTHILVECIFSQKVWALILHGLPISFFPLTAELVTLFKNWQPMYPNTLSSIHVWRKIWQAIPKFIWWKIWLARNRIDLQQQNSETRNYSIKI